MITYASYQMCKGEVQSLAVAEGGGGLQQQNKEEKMRTYLR